MLQSRPTLNPPLKRVLRLLPLTIHVTPQFVDDQKQIKITAIRVVQGLRGATSYFSDWNLIRAEELVALQLFRRCYTGFITSPCNCWHLPHLTNDIYHSAGSLRSVLGPWVRAN